MDALALLCTLHADGPTTLQRLRASGCETLEHVARFDTARLVELLGTTEGAALRFQREAGHLDERVGHVQAPERAAARPAARAKYADVLDRWRELDMAEASNEMVEPIVEESSAPRVRPSPRTASRTPIGRLGEMGDALTAALELAKIRDLESLAACDALAVSRTSGVPYTSVVRFAALARRALAPGERFSHAERPSRAPAPLVELAPFAQLAASSQPFVLTPLHRVAPAPAAAASVQPVAAGVEAAGGPFA